MGNRRLLAGNRWRLVGNGCWRVTDGNWRVIDGGWQETDGGWRVIIWSYGLYQTKDEKFLVLDTPAFFFSSKNVLTIPNSFQNRKQNNR